MMDRDDMESALVELTTAYDSIRVRCGEELTMRAMRDDLIAELAILDLLAEVES